MNTFSTSSTRTHGPRLNPAIAKAKLLSESLRAASRLQLPPPAIALLAVLIAESWPSGDGWSLSIARSTLANRLSVTTRTIDRTRNDLIAAGLINHTPGDPRRASSFTICEHPGSDTGVTSGETAASPQGRQQSTTRGDAHDTPAVTPVAPSSVWQNSASAGGGTNGAAAAAVGSVDDCEPGEIPEEILERRVKAILRRPDWLPQGKPWISQAKARQLARSTTLRTPDWDRINKEAKDSRHTLTNPAGWIIREIQQLEQRRTSTAEQAPRPR